MHAIDSKRIDRALLVSVLALHERAYAILLALGRAALLDPQVLSREAESALLDPRRVVGWLRAQGACDAVATAEHDALGALVRSFFHTSFHVQRFEVAGVVDARLALGPRVSAPSHARRARHGGSATHEALHRICRDEGLRVGPAALRLVARSSALRDDVRLWTYAVGLVVRARGGGEGIADWAAWRALRRQGHGSIDADAVWEARERLRSALETSRG